MTNETQQMTTNDHKINTFGARLKSARESIGLDRKDAAAQLRLSETVITMMERERYPDDLPITFVRGYIRSYGKLLQIPELEITQALEPIKPKTSEPDPLTLAKTPATVTSGNYFMQLSTYLIILTMVALLGVWWYSHTSTRTSPAAENKLLALPENTVPNGNNASPSATPTLITPATPENQPQKNAAPTPASTEVPQQTNHHKPVSVAKQPPAQEEDSADEDDTYDTAQNSDNNN